MSDLVQVEVQNDVAVITLNNPPVNALSQAVCRTVLTTLEQAAGNDAEVHRKPEPLLTTLLIRSTKKSSMWTRMPCAA